MRIAYADPPYPGQAKKHYGPDAREVNHRLLISHLETFDGWALSTSVKGLPLVLPLCPKDVLVLSWEKTVAPPMGDNRIYSWEPVIIHGGRKPETPTRMTLRAAPPQFTFRETPEGHVTGEKPRSFCIWVFRNLGAQPGDELVDLFPGSGAVSEAWDAWIQQTRMAV